MALALPATTFATDSAATKAAPAEMRTRREDNIDREQCTGACGARARERTLSALHGGGGARERAHGGGGLRCLGRGLLDPHEVRQAHFAPVLLMEHLGQRGGDR